MGRVRVKGIRVNRWVKHDTNTTHQHELSAPVMYILSTQKKKVKCVYILKGVIITSLPKKNKKTKNKKENSYNHKNFPSILAKLNNLLLRHVWLQ